MALPLPNMGRRGFLADAMDASEEARGTKLKNALMQLTNQYYAPNMESEIANRNALTKGYDIDNQFKPERFALDNEHSRQVNQMYIPNMQSEISGRNSLTKERLAMLPLNMQEKQIANGWADRLNQSKLDAAKSLEGYRASGGGRGGTAEMKNEQYFQKLVGQDNPGLAPEQWYEAANVLRSGGDTLSDGTLLKPLSEAARGQYNSMIKHSNTAQGVNQQRFANTLENLFNKVEGNAQKAFKYSGVAGKAKGGFDNFTSQVSPSDPDYLAYRKFIDEDVPGLVTEIIRTGGANSTNAQKAIAIKQAMPINMKTAPEVAKADYEELKNIYHNIAGTILEGPGETQISLKKGNKPSESSPKKATLRYNQSTGNFEEVK